MLPINLQESIPYVTSHVKLAIKDPGGSKRYVEVQTRSISTSRVTFIAQTFCHVNSVAVIDLPKPDGSAMRIRGVIRDCIHSKGRMHAVLMEFESKLDLSVFMPPEMKEMLAAKRESKADPSETEQRRVVRVLYIDDHDADRMLMKHRTKSTHIELVAVDSAGGACDKLKLEKFDAVLCDFHLDDSNGLEVMSQIRPSLHTGPVIMVTAETSETEFERMIEAGADAVLTKPLDVLRLSAVIEAAIDAASNPAAIRLDPFDAPSSDEDLIRSFIPVLVRHSEDFARAKSKRNAELARKTCRAVAGTAGGFGFHRLARSAERALAAIDAAGNLDLAGKPLNEFRLHLGAIIAAAEVQFAAAKA